MAFGLPPLPSCCCLVPLGATLAPRLTFRCGQEAELERKAAFCLKRISGRGAQDRCLQKDQGERWEKAKPRGGGEISHPEVCFKIRSGALGALPVFTLHQETAVLYLGAGDMICLLYYSLSAEVF